MTLPPLPEPAMVYINATGESTRCHNETQLIEYGELCAATLAEALTKANRVIQQLASDGDAKIKAARREGAEAMREACAVECARMKTVAGTDDVERGFNGALRRAADNIRALEIET